MLLRIYMVGVSIRYVLAMSNYIFFSRCVPFLFEGSRRRIGACFILIRVCLPLESVATLKVSGSPFRHWITLLKFNSTGAKKGIGRGQ